MDRPTPARTHPAVAKLQAIEAELNRYLVRRNDEVHGALLALIARQHVFFLGAPGTAKSLMSSELCRRVRGAVYFKKLLTAYTLPDELFGPVSIKALHDDRLVRRFEGYLPDAHIAQIDEIWKCPSSTLNSMLTILNEREFLNDTTTVRAPLVSAFVTSNEVPPADASVNALYDRVLLRFNVLGLTETADRKAATAFSHRMRTFVAEAARQAAALAAKDADVAGVLGNTAPDRWLLDDYGEFFADPDLRERALAGEEPVKFPDKAKARLAPLLNGMLVWAHEQEMVLPYSAYLEVSDLDVLYRLVLSVTLPEPVEDAFYRILTGVVGESVIPNVSVRREAEMRVLVAASAVMAGRAVAHVEDLDVLTDCLWDTPTQRPGVKRIVDAETGAYSRQFEALAQTVAAWDHVRAEDSFSVKLSAREQIKSDLRRVEEFASRSPDDAEAAALADEARRKAQGFEDSIFNFGDDAPAPARQAPAPAPERPSRPSPLVEGMRVVVVDDDTPAGPRPPAPAGGRGQAAPEADAAAMPDGPDPGLYPVTSDPGVYPAVPAPRPPQPAPADVDGMIDSVLGAGQDEADRPPAHDDPWDTLSGVDQPPAGPILLLPPSDKGGGGAR